MHYLWPLLLVLVNALGVLLTLVCLPGNWLMVAVAAIYAHFGGHLPFSFGWATVAVLFGLAAVGELVEFLAGAVGATRAGGSRRAAALSIVGSIAGGIAGLIIGLPIPIMGSLVAAVVFSALGAMAGAMLGEKWKGTETGQASEVGQAAFWGRLAGTAGKSAISALMFAVAALALLL